ncbi:MAG: hypothetical protein NTV51_12200 [Verrucomicrobia bacterium]|nr:hypothetical protein [Verrucomicrobiota bacterium]
MPIPNSAVASATFNHQLTSYAQGNWNDQADVIKVAERLAPTTSVQGAAGQYKKFDDKNSFLAENTARALGGDPKVISFSADDDSYNCKPQALETRVDKVEDQQAGSAGGDLAAQLLDQGKIKALVNKSALSHAKDVSDYVVANTNAIADRGNWSNKEVDPIEQLDEQLLAISQDVGSTQNVKVTMDLGSWYILRNHPLVRARVSKVQATPITLQQLNDNLLFPVDLMAANVVYDTKALGQAADKKRLLAGVVLVHYSVPNPTVYDPSAFKCFTVGASSFIAGVRTYQAPNGLWRGHLMDWSRDIKKTSSLAVRRFNIA